jgi:hypothetical protein
MKCFDLKNNEKNRDQLSNLNFTKGDETMSLQVRLDKMREEFESNVPQEALALMHRATNDLLASGIMDGVLKSGDHAPDFSLTDQSDNLVQASALLSDGPLVISFYRGVW